jgi:lipopolysaccharide export LptBFGC system permease protein LptF
MRQIYTLILLSVLCGCSKEQMVKNAVIDAMTSGQWKVVNFKNDNNDVTTDFATYKFQFKDNLTVDAINNSIVENTGTWTADGNARTISSTFKNANATISLLNGTWQITDNSWTYVVANQTVNGTIKSLRLEKL